MHSKHHLYFAYMRMALGLTILPDGYTREFGDQEIQVALQDENGKGYSDLVTDMEHFDLVWTDQPLVAEICQAWGISRARFIRSMAAPKPGTIAHLVYCGELMRMFGERLPEWPRGRGLIIPVWKGKEITEIKFHHMNEILKPRAKVAA